MSMPGNRYTHRIICEGGPLDGSRFEFDSDELVPWRVITLDPPGLEPVQYMRLMPLTPMRPGDAWIYVPLRRRAATETR